MTFFRDACGTGQGSKDSSCACGTGQGNIDVLCAPLETALPAVKSGTDLLCAPLVVSDSSQSNGAAHAEETLAKVREICTMPHGADPAETFLMDILRDSGDFTGVKTGMSIKFFLPEELYDLWNTTFAAYLQQSVAEGTMLRRVNDVEDIYRSPLDYADSAESFLAALLQGWLLTEKAHLRFARNYAILKRDRFRCQVPGCNCRRNLHIHHIIPRSQGGSDEPENKITLCEKHHLRLLHNLLTLKIEGTAPHNLTFTFGPPSHGDGRPFLKYVRGRKVLTEKNNIMLSQ